MAKLKRKNSDSFIISALFHNIKKKEKGRKLVWKKINYTFGVKIHVHALNILHARVQGLDKF